MGNFCLFVRMRALLDSVRETPPHLVAVVRLNILVTVMIFEGLFCRPVATSVVWRAVA